MTKKRPDRDTLIAQTKLAFDLVQRLYDECALLVRELELLLHREREQFVVARPAGYGISTRRSVGLEPTSVQLWPLRKFGILFVPEAATERGGGQTRTSFKERVLYLRFLLDDYSSTTFAGESLREPSVIFGVFNEVIGKKRFKKYEDLLTHIEYIDTGVFAHMPTVEYEDANIKLSGMFDRISLFALVDAESVDERLAKPAVLLYRGGATPPAGP